MIPRALDTARLLRLSILISLFQEILVQDTLLEKSPLEVIEVCNKI